jgi:UrcA family protein
MLDLKSRAMMVYVAAASILLGVTSSVFPGSVMAADSLAVTSVGYSDLDLTEPEARGELNRRVGKALQSVCERPGRLTAYEIQARQRCLAQARPPALAQMRGAIEQSRVRASTVRTPRSVIAAQD